MTRRKAFWGLTAGLTLVGLLGIVVPAMGMCGDCASLYGTGDVWCVSNPPNFVFCRTWSEPSWTFTLRPDGTILPVRTMVEKCEAYVECAY